MKIIILGAGLVGSPMAIDLAKDSEFSVTAVDNKKEPLELLEKNYNIDTIRANLLESKTVKKLVANYDLVISAVPGFMGFRTLKTVIEAGKNVVDIAFFPEDPFQLDELAKKNKVTAVIDCGVAPGMSNILIGYEYEKFQKINSAVIYVGGLPEVRELPFEYKAVFSPSDVIEEYLRPARYIQDGKLIVKKALTEPEIINFSEVGSLEAFNTDGLRTLAHTLSIPNMKEKTMRYPGHIDKIKLLKEMGLFSKEEIEINGCEVRPIDLTTKLLFPHWKLEKGDSDITIMRIEIRGSKDGKEQEVTYELFDKYDEETGIHSMARTTGYTATMTARIIAKDLYSNWGIIAPEYLGNNPAMVEYILKGLEERGVIYKRFEK